MELSGISTTSTKYGTGVAYTSAPNGKYELTVEAGSSTGTFSLKNGSNYLYWSSGNSLNKTTTKDAKASWTITFSNGNAIIKNANTSARQLQWNASSPRFACYDNSGQTAVQLYKKVISEESEDVIVKMLKSIEVTPKTINYETGDVFKFDGTCTATYGVTKNDEPQADETVVVTPTTVSTPDMSTAGTKEITVTYTEDGVTVTDTYEIEVTQNEVTPGAYTGNLNNTFFGCAVGNNATEQSGKFDDVLVVAGCKSSASSKTNYQSGHVRFYADSYLTLSVPTGYVIKSIVFTADGTWSGSITVSAGTYTDGTKTWAGNAQEVKFSFAAQNRIKSVKVTYAADVKYAVNITTPSNGTLVVKEGSAVLADGAQVYEGTKLVVTPTPNAGYVFESLTVGEEAVELTDGTYTFNMPAADVTISATFKENEKPAATLTLSKNGVEELFPGSWKQDDVVTLPSITSDCVKEFVGWSADANCATEPEYKAGDEYTLVSTTLTQTLYAVYATVGGGGEATAANTLSSNGWANESKHTSLQIDENVKAEITGTGLSNSGKYYDSGTNWRLYQNENPNLTISTTIGELKSVKFTFTYEKTGTLLYNGTKLTSGTAVEVSGTSATFTIGNSSADVTNGQIRISKIEVVYTGGVSYSEYSTECVAALDEPVFSVEGGENEEKTITLTATKGTIYYTLDGSTPTASSEKYTTPIVLDECGEHTIKAIAISSDSESPVASDTYTIDLPILANSETDPYTETEAVEVYNGGCYDGAELVYVKGTVKTATFYSSGTYTITLTNGFQFYKFYKTAGKELFTDGAINAGDVLVACGKLSKYNTTYQLAEGCYLVAHEPYTEPKVDISNDEASAYTVDKAFELIGDVSNDLTKEVYVKGLVAVAPTSNPTADGQMTYKISDNGENTGNVLTVYLGLNLNGEKFTSKNEVQQGDYVVVKGKLLDYNSTYELNKGNQLVQHKKAATISIADITMEVGETKTIAATITPDAAKTEVAYSIKAGSDDCITLSDNNITAKAEGTATIVATIATAAEYMGKTVEFKVTVTPQNIATLPFTFDKGKNDIASTLGMSQKNLGADYDSSPKLKFDNKDDYVIIHFDERPGILSYDIKANTGSGTFSGEFAVQESADGVTYRDLVKHSTISGSKETKTHNCFDKDTRYIKFIFTTKGNGNVALGNIKIEKSVVTKVTPTVVANSYFSVGEGEFVQFSTGNLQYEVGTNTWSFASEQYEVIGGEAYTGSNNTNYGMNVPGYTGKLDLFAWSCNGKFGVNPSNADADYTGEFADWGDLVSEAGWSTLTRAQMEYLLERKKDGKKLWGLATLEGKVALILLPDNWNTAIEFTYGYVPTKWNFTANELTKEDWNNLEANGAVLLPAGGSRAGGYGNKIGFDGETVETDATKLDANGDYFHVDNVGDYGYYWLSSTAGELADYLILPASDNTGANTYSPDVWSREKRRGNSVRLVKAVKPDYERDVRQGYYGTICLPTAGQMVGASIFEIAYKDASKIYFDEIVSGKMEAGIPYIFLPNEGVTTLKVFYTEMAVVAAGSRNGLVGYYNNTDDMFNVPIGNYILLNNQYCEVVGMNAYIMQNYSYIVLDDVPDPDSAPAPAPGVRRISMGVNGQNTATGVDQVQGDNVPTKMIINGQLYILRGEKMYDAQGKLVK